MKTLNDLLERYETDLKDYEQAAEAQEWDENDSVYYEGACSALETAITQLKQVIKAQEANNPNQA